MTTDNQYDALEARVAALADQLDGLTEAVNEQAMMFHALANDLGITFIDQPVDPIQPSDHGPD